MEGYQSEAKWSMRQGLKSAELERCHGIGSRLDASVNEAERAERRAVGRGDRSQPVSLVLVVLGLVEKFRSKITVPSDAPPDPSPVASKLGTVIFPFFERLLWSCSRLMR